MLGVRSTGCQGAADPLDSALSDENAVPVSGALRSSAGAGEARRGVASAVAAAVLFGASAPLAKRLLDGVDRVLRLDRGRLLPPALAGIA